MYENNHQCRQGAATPSCNTNFSENRSNIGVTRSEIEGAFVAAGFHNLPFGIHQSTPEAGPTLISYPSNTHVFPVFSGGCIALVGAERLVSAWGGAKPLGVVALESCTKEDVEQVVAALSSTPRGATKVPNQEEKNVTVSSQELLTQASEDGPGAFTFNISPMLSTQVSLTSKSVEFLTRESSPPALIISISK